ADPCAIAAIGRGTLVLGIGVDRFEPCRAQSCVAGPVGARVLGAARRDVRAAALDALTRAAGPRTTGIGAVRQRRGHAGSGGALPFVARSWIALAGGDVVLATLVATVGATDSGSRARRMSALSGGVARVDGAR